MEQLPTVAQQWICDVVGASAEISTIRQLQGATSATLHAVDVQQGGVTHELVIRRFTNALWLATEPDLAPHEAAVLQCAGRQSAVPVPELVAVDEYAAVCDVPAILMTRLPGDVVCLPADTDAWLRQMAEALAAIHAIRADDLAWTYSRWYEPDALKVVPTWTANPALWQAVQQKVAEFRPSDPIHFIHRDYHQTNTIWVDGKLTGVVDWVNACRGCAGVDISHMRINLVAMLGLGAAMRFYDHYRSMTGFQYDPTWDLLGVIDGGYPEFGVYPPWLTFGVTGLTDTLVRQRIETFVESSLRQLTSW